MEPKFLITLHKLPPSACSIPFFLSCSSPPHQKCKSYANFCLSTGCGNLSKTPFLGHNLMNIAQIRLTPEAEILYLEEMKMEIVVSEVELAQEENRLREVEERDLFIDRVPRFNTVMACILPYSDLRSDRKGQDAAYQGEASRTYFNDGEDEPLPRIERSIPTGTLNGTKEKSDDKVLAPVLPDGTPRERQ
ncbi:hypothetical protein SASPL_113605 [Salvia splendens]|uniref:Uncharacterized protein n=1 Tax=Salvia splendens TaxID=180675 RepID=A0A8X8XZ83_SALSN|nr:hypothetical protein SASPL_113605 [Salvia splendens]